MLLFGHRFIPSISFYHIVDIDAIDHTPPSSVLLIVFHEDNLDLISHAHDNNILFALQVNTVTEIIYAANLGCSFIIIEKHMANIAQNIAENYLFDAKILVQIHHDTEIEKFALLNIDGAIYPNAIVKINS